MIYKIGVGNRAELLLIEPFDNGTNNSAAIVVVKLVSLLIMAPVLKCGVTICFR